MALYFISYDLRKVRNYQLLYNALADLKAKPILESDWCVYLDGTSCTQIRDHLRSFMDSDDGIMVSEVANWASHNALVTPNDL